MYTLVILSPEDDVARLEHSARAALGSCCEEEVIHVPAGEYASWLSNLAVVAIRDQLHLIVVHCRADDEAEQAVLSCADLIRRIGHIQGSASTSIRSHIC